MAETHDVHVQSCIDSTSRPEPSRKRPRTAVRDNDLTVLYTPSPDSIIADLIFVHGLQGHPLKTWQYLTETLPKKQSLFGIPRRKRSRGEYEESSDSIFWPADLLPDDYKNFRVLTYGYDSHVSHYFNGPANKLNLSQLGEGLLNRVVGERRRSNVTGRPIVFVAHSLGGLLVKEALVESRKQGHHSNKRDVYKSTQGIVFFGTPHKGSNDAKWGLILRAIASAAFDTNDKILRALEPDNEPLDKLARDFQDIVDKGNLKICSLLESAGKTGLPIFNGKVVPDFSASFGSRKFEHQDYIEKNHINMCRFAGREDGGYSRFRDGLEFCIGALLDVLDVENTREDLLHSLKFDAMLTREAQLADAPAITLDWVWTLPVGRSSLTQWLSTQAGVFWIQGKPGSGKSTLMNYLKGHSQTKNYLAQTNRQDWVIIRFFFDFRARNGVSNSFDGLLRALLFQLALEIPELSPSIAEFGRVAMLQRKAQQELCWTAAKLREALLSALRICTMNVLILVDGVDELEGDGRNMLDMVEFFQELASLDNKQGLIKICIASRPDPLIITAFGASFGFALQDYNRNGIERYITRRLKIAAQDPEIPAYFESGFIQFAESITKRSHGVFLWARFATDELLEGLADGDEPNELLARLQSLPDELEEIYARIIDRTIRKCGGSQETSVILQIAYFTLRSLSLQEFFVIFQLSMQRKVPDGSPNLTAFEKRLRAKAGGLVEVVGGAKKEVKLMHETVRAYLDRLSGGSGCNFTDSSNDSVFLEQSILGDVLESEEWSSLTSSREAKVFPAKVPRSKHPNTTLNLGLGVSEHHIELEQDHVALEERSFLSTVLNQVDKPFSRIGETFKSRNVTPSLPSANCNPRREPFENENKRASQLFADQQIQDQAAMIRRVGACLPCRMQHISCKPDMSDAEGTCLRCMKLSTHRPAIHCIRDRLSSCMLSQRNCTVLDWLESLPAGEHLAIKNQARAWNGKGSLNVKLNRSYGAPLKLAVRGFVLEERPERPTTEFIYFNALGIESLVQATLAARICVNESLHACVNTKIDEEDRVAIICFQAALSMVSQPMAGQLILQTLRVWDATRGLEDSWHISSAQVSNCWSDSENQVPLPPILRYQLETILQRQILKPLEAKVLHDLGKALFNAGRRNWLMIFLVTFILLHNCDLSVAQHRLLCRDAQKRYSNKEKLRDIEVTGRTLLAHFHYIYGRFRFFSSDSRDWPTNSRVIEIDDAAKDLILSIRGIIPEVDKQMSRYLNPEEYEGISWFRGQMFVSDWTPIPSIQYSDASVESDSASGE